tara:strand:+ start:404 stop:1054 length:651 start_codon:yes stop_codon:yes gene_type:complete
MPTREILNSHTAPTLRKEISKTNIKGYSKMTKPELIDVMMKHADRFHHIKMRDVGFPIKALFKGKKEEPKKVKATKSKTGIFKMKEEPKAKKAPAKKAPVEKKAPAKKEAPKKAPAKKSKQAQLIDDITSMVEYELQDQIQEIMEALADIKFPNKEGNVNAIFKWMEKYDEDERKKIKKNIQKLIKAKGEKLDNAEQFHFFVLDRKKWKNLLIDAV